MLSTEPSGRREAGGPPLTDVLEEHLEELGLLALQRRKLLFSPEISLRRLLLHERRMEAHGDGLRVGGTASVAVAQSLLDDDDPWLGYAVRRTWLEHGAPDAEAAAEKIEAPPAPAESLPSWKEAFRDLTSDTAERLFPPASIPSLLPKAQSVAADALGWHRRLPQSTAELLARAENPDVRRSVARHADGVALLEQLAGDDDAGVRDVALWSLSLLNPGRGLQLARSRVGASPAPRFPLRVLGLLGTPDDAKRIVEALTDETLILPALCALGDLGDPTGAGAALAYLEHEQEEVAEAARDTLERVTGARFPAQAPGEETEAPSALGAFWDAQLRGMSPGLRHLRGVGFPPGAFDADPSLELLWRLAVAVPVEEAQWLRRIVPDGFFSGVPCAEALPGE